MNRRDKDVLYAIATGILPRQRDLAQACGCSLGAVNASVQALEKEGYIHRDMDLTEKSLQLFSACAPKRAVLLAAGFGLRRSRSVGELPKALLEVHGEPLIDRLIRQLQDVGIREIYVIVGFAKEQFEYLIDRYGVKLIVNPEYAEKNNLHSLALAKAHLENCYVVPCDLWCKENPFRNRELYSWYMVSDRQSPDSSVRINRKQELAVIPPASMGNVMVGISYLTGNDSVFVQDRLTAMDADRRCKGYFWEETLYESGKLHIGPRQIPAEMITEINNPEDLVELNTRSMDIAITQICRLMDISPDEIRQLQLIKRGMTNTSFRFVYRNDPCIIRIPTGSSIRIDRKREAVYAALAGEDIADEVICFDPETGIKISRFLEDSHPCDPQNREDINRCMQMLQRFHQKGIQTTHAFDLFGEISYYESLWGGAPSLYPDYSETRQQIFSLGNYIESQEKQLCLTHLDAVPENFLMKDRAKDVRLIDWEHAAMADPHLDIAQFCLQALYERPQVDQTIDAYFPEGCPKETRIKIYCYIAASGLLWSNWCEHEIRQGVEFGAYSLWQYRYAKEYYRIVQEERKKIKGV